MAHFGRQLCPSVVPLAFNTEADSETHLQPRSQFNRKNNNISLLITFGAIMSVVQTFKNNVAATGEFHFNNSIAFVSRIQGNNRIRNITEIILGNTDEYDLTTFKCKTFRKDGHLHRYIIISILTELNRAQIENLYTHIYNICGREIRATSIYVNGGTRDLFYYFDDHHVYPQHAYKGDGLMIFTRGYKKDRVLKKKDFEKLCASDAKRSYPYLIHQTQEYADGTKAIFTEYRNREDNINGVTICRAVVRKQYVSSNRSRSILFCSWG